MKGLTALRLQLSTVGIKHQELELLARLIRSRPPRDLDAVWGAVNEALVAMEELERHVRMMIVVNEPGYVAPALTEDVRVLS